MPSPWSIEVASLLLVNMRSWFQAGVALLAPSASLVLGQQVRDLSGDGWTLSSSALDKSIPARLPSQAHLDLMRAGVIDDPSYRLNEFDLRWIVKANWTYTSDPIQGLVGDSDSTWLVFDGLDTYTTIEFCGQFIGTTDNQFRQWTFDVSDVMKHCKKDPVLSLNFGSATEITEAIASEPGAPTWPFGIEQQYQFPHRAFMRKEQSDFGWDWGPAFAPAGPWKPAYIVQHPKGESMYVLNTDLDIYRKGQINYLPPDQSAPWVVNASIDYLGTLPKDPSMSILVKDAESGEVITSKSAVGVTVAEGAVTGHIFVYNQPKLWWPAQMGDQNLYDVEITVNGDDEKPFASVTKRSGFRTIFLNQRNITDEQIAQGIAPGANWHFEINGRPFYAKGSNFIPPDTFWPRVEEAKMTRLFNTVLAGNQNMLRVWSSGAYLPDFIYDLADKMGILLWSEFQFSCALYPTDDPFLENVAAEVVYNVRRVNHHPSLALWAGGNEIESLELPMVKDAEPEKFDFYVGEYEKLHISTILPLVYANTRSISYMPSSTTNGYLDIDLSAEVPMTERYWNLTDGHYYGDTDFYNYNTDESFDYSTYPVGRFANEFGFHSMPSLQSWRQAVDPSDLEDFNSTAVVLRNRHYPPGGWSTDNFHNASIGMKEMTMAVETYYPTPYKTDSVANFSSWCHATQLFQSDFYKSQIQFYRRGSGMPERQLGSLYWQLEDQWIASTWSGVELDGRWKVLHYMARDIYKPVIISPFWNYTTGHLEVYVTSDLWESVSGTVNLQWLDLRGNPIANNAGTPRSAKFEVGALNTTAVYSTNLSKLSIPNPQNSILLLSVETRGHMPNSNRLTSLTHSNHFIPAWPKDLKLVDPKLDVSYNSVTGKFTVEAKSGVALYTWLDYPSGVVGYFDENSFVLVPGQKKEIGFMVQDDQTAGNWVEDVTVSSLWDLTTTS